MELTTSPTVGIIANPASARDVRRIVASGSAVTVHAKVNVLQRVLAGLAATGVRRVISLADGAGIAAGLLRLADRPSARGWPTIELADHPITGTAADTTAATEAMVDAGVGAIVVLGGDGTNRVVAASAGATPLLSIATGTNNAFPRTVEPTVAGVAAGLVATDNRCATASTQRMKKLVVTCGARVEEAVVDVAISSADGVGAGAVWDPSTISELFMCFAEPDAIGLSSIGGQLQPIERHQPRGLSLVLGEPATAVVAAPIGPGLVVPVNVRSVSTLTPDTPVEVRAPRGVLAIDGERLVRFGPSDRPQVTLRLDGPVVVDVAAVLDHAARHQLLVTPGPDPSVPPPTSPPTPQPRREPPCSHSTGSSSTPRWSASGSTSRGSCRNTTPTRPRRGTSAPA